MMTLKEIKTLYHAQAPVKVEGCTIYPKCRGGKIHKIREDETVIIYCKGMACTTVPEKIEIMKKENKGGSAG